MDVGGKRLAGDLWDFPSLGSGPRAGGAGDSRPCLGKKVWLSSPDGTVPETRTV